MSSLLQSPLRVERRGIEIYLIREKDSKDKNGKFVMRPPLYRIWRKPAGMWGCWVLIRLNGKEYPMDFSVPHTMYRLPRDAKPVSAEDADKYWSS